MWKIGVIALLLAAIAVPSALFATQGQEATEARVAAYKHEDGRVEFAIQVRDGNTWGERILPRGRTLGTNARTGRWLTSTPVALPGSSSTAGDFVPVVAWNGLDDFGLDYGEISYRSGWFTHAGTLHTKIAMRDVFSALQNPRIESVILSTYCEQGKDGHGSDPTFRPATFKGEITYYVHGPYGSPQMLRDYHTHGRLNEEGTYRSDLPAVAFCGYRRVDGPWSDYDIRWWRDDLDFDREFMHELRQYARLAVQIGVQVDGEWQTFSALFDNLQEFFNTPLQDNINRCGEYPLTVDYTGPREPEPKYEGEQ